MPAAPPRAKSAPTDEIGDWLVTILAEGSSGHLALARRLLSNEQDAREVLQETWLRAWRHRKGLCEAVSIQAWLRRILVRECYRALSRRRARAWLSLVFEAPEEVDSRPRADEILTEAARRDALARAVSALSPRQRLVWGLRFDEGWTLPEIADATGLGVETVRTHLARALAGVRDRMEVCHAL